LPTFVTETTVIGRVWHGWTSLENAAAYETLLRSAVLPGIRRVAGYRGAHLLRHDGTDEVEFVTITWFDSAESVRAFAGPDEGRAVVPDAARALLSRFDERSVHYTLIEDDSAVQAGHR
jgi:heme-degrading monooxygenase HmoA